MKNTDSNPPSLQLGDTVAYSRAFLRSIGAWQASYSDLRGTVTEVHPPRHGVPPVVNVVWQDGTEIRALTCNLVLASRLHLEPR